MNAYVKTPAEAEGAEISQPRQLAIKIGIEGGYLIARSEPPGLPASGLQCVLIPPDVLATCGVTADTAAFSEVITLKGPEFNPRPHPSDRSVEKRTFVVHFAGGQATVAPFRVVRGRVTEKKSAASVINGLMEARRRKARNLAADESTAENPQSV